MEVTIKDIREKKPCTDSWVVLLKSLKAKDDKKADATKVDLKHILDTLGVVDAIWALRCVKDMDKEIRLFACECAESVLPIYEERFPSNKIPRKAIEASRGYAEGELKLFHLKQAKDSIFEASNTSATDVTSLISKLNKKQFNEACRDNAVHRAANAAEKTTYPEAYLAAWAASSAARAAVGYEGQMKGSKTTKQKRIEEEMDKQSQLFVKYFG